MAEKEKKKKKSNKLELEVIRTYLDKIDKIGIGNEVR